MLFQASDFVQKEEEFYKKIIKDYLTYGSVDSVFEKNKYNLPISYAGMHRLINRWGIIKSVGPNSTLSEAITFLTLLTDKNISVEKLYKKLPLSFKTSLSTLHRILHNVKEGLIRRYGTALIITPFNQDSMFLIGEDITPAKSYLGKKVGSLTLPMTYSKKDEDPKTSILRVLQQEVFSNLALDKVNICSLIPPSPKSFMNLSIADINVGVYKIELPENFFKERFSSYKVKNHKFVTFEEFKNKRKLFRAGVKEIIKCYEELVSEDIAEKIVTSEVNLALQESA